MIGTFNSFVTLKEHKENFMNHRTARLHGRISEYILDQLNKELISKLSVKEWKKHDKCNQVVQEY